MHAARFMGKWVVILGTLLFGVLCTIVFCRAQPTQNVRVDLKKSQDRVGTRCIDIYLTNLTSEEVYFSENILSNHSDIYGGIWSVSKNSEFYLWDSYTVERRRLDLKLKNASLFWHFSPPSSRLAPGERERVSSIYVLSKQNELAGAVSVQLRYQPGRELKSSWDEQLPYGEFFERIFERFPLHHALLSRETYWSNTIKVAPIKLSEIKGSD